MATVVPPSDEAFEEPAPGVPKHVRWRVDEFVRLGLDTFRAVTLAERRDPETGRFVDLHEFEALRRRGATPDQAFEILA